MPVSKVEATKPQSPLEMKDQQGNPLFLESNGEIIVAPGAVPAPTILKEIQEGAHHAGS